MWSLKDVSTGRTIRSNMKSQWEACVSAVQEDGRHFKKTEALALPEGAIIYKPFREKCSMKVDIYDAAGNFTGEQIRFTTCERLHAFQLLKG